MLFWTVTVLSSCGSSPEREAPLMIARTRRDATRRCSSAWAVVALFPFERVHAVGCRAAERPWDESAKGSLSSILGVISITVSRSRSCRRSTFPSMVEVDLAALRLNYSPLQLREFPPVSASSRQISSPTMTSSFTGAGRAGALARYKMLMPHSGK